MRSQDCAHILYHSLWARLFWFGRWRLPKPPASGSPVILPRDGLCVGIPGRPQVPSAGGAADWTRWTRSWPRQAGPVTDLPDRAGLMEIQV